MPSHSTAGSSTHPAPSATIAAVASASSDEKAIAAAKPASIQESEHFGFTPQQTSEKEKQSQDARKPRATLTAKIREIDSTPTGEFIAVLENDQTWVQKETNSRARLKPGDEITIRPAALGSYLMTTAQGVVTRVKRMN